VFSGKGKGIDGLTEAAWMASRYAGPGIVKVEGEADSTASNVMLSAKLMSKDSTVIVISNNDHVISAAWCLRYKYSFDAKWIMWPNNMVPTIPTYQPIECERAGCCK
jgi:hypothetical protein